MLPRRCVACAAGGALLCDVCEAALGGPCTTFVDGLAVQSACGYGGAARACIVAFKERGARGLVPHLGALLADAVARTDIGTSVNLVPVPASPRARRTRGEDVVRRLAEHATMELARRGYVARTLPLLTLRSSPRDQVGLGRAARYDNLRGRMSAESRTAPSGPVVLVDDVVTTGATLAEARRALEAAGLTVAAAATVAATRASVYRGGYARA